MMLLKGIYISPLFLANDFLPVIKCLLIIVAKLAVVCLVSILFGRSLQLRLVYKRVFLIRSEVGPIIEVFSLLLIIFAIILLILFPSERILPFFATINFPLNSII